MKIHVKDILKKYPYTFYAYGSRVTGTHKPSSDLDLYFFKPIPFNIQSHIEEDFEESDLPFRVDLTDYNLMRENFRKLIKKDFIIIQASNKFLEAENNLFAKLIYLQKKLGYPVHKTNAYTVVNCKLATSMFNIVCDTKFTTSTNINKQIQKVIDSFDNLPFAWWLGPSTTPQNLGIYLEKHRLIQETTEYAMWLDLTKQNTAPSKTNLQIEVVTSEKNMYDFARIIKTFDEAAASLYEQAAQQLDLTDNLPLRLFVGYIDNKPITIGSIFFTENLAGIFDLVTLQDYRNQGFATAMLKYMLNYAYKLGFKHASLSASSDAGLRLYQKLGFATIGIFNCFEWYSKN